MTFSSRKQFCKIAILALAIAWLSPTIAQAQRITLGFHAEGPGAVTTYCPEPCVVGQGFLLCAQAVLGAKFVSWEDDSTAAQHYLS